MPGFWWRQCLAIDNPVPAPSLEENPRSMMGIGPSHYQKDRADCIIQLNWPHSAVDIVSQHCDPRFVKTLNSNQQFAGPRSTSTLSAAEIYLDRFSAEHEGRSLPFLVQKSYTERYCGPLYKTADLRKDLVTEEAQTGRGESDLDGPNADIVGYKQ